MKKKILFWSFLPLGLVHLGIIVLRNKLFDCNILKARRLDRPVISVGNIQMGGAGKTPMVLELLKLLEKNQQKVGVLTRGYKRASRKKIIVEPTQLNQQKAVVADLGDEPYLILQKLQKGALGVGADRCRIGQRMLEEFSVDVFLLDDGFQYRKLHRDIDICLIDVSRWSSHPFLFPLSYLRDYKSSLRRADLFVLTKFGRHNQRAEVLKNKLNSKYSTPVLKGQYVLQSLIKLDNQQKINPQEIKPFNVGALCGIANPDDFFDLLQDSGFKVVFKKSFPDHYDFKIEDILRIIKSAKQAGADWLIVTEKDGVKLKECFTNARRFPGNILVLSIDFEFDDKLILLKLLKNIAL